MKYAAVCSRVIRPEAEECRISSEMLLEKNEVLLFLKSINYAV